MNHEFEIKKIKSVYYRETVAWQHSSCAPRIFYAVVLFTQGAIEYDFNGQSVVAQKGDLLFLPCNVPYSGKQRSDRVSYFVIDFTAIAPKIENAFSVPYLIKAKNFEQSYSRFQDAMRLWRENILHGDLQIKALLYSVMSEIFLPDDTGLSTIRDDKIVRYIISNIENPELKVADLCRAFYISESQLRRNLKKRTGLSPNEYILTLRINKAKNELFSTDKSIKDIAFSCGFSSPYYFSRCFSNSTGISPLKYRKLTRI